MITSWFVFSLITITLFAIISNSSPTGVTAIEEQFERLTCPMPAGSGLWNSSGTLIYDNGTYNYPDVNTQTLTLTCTNVHTLDGVDYYFGQPTVAIGVFFFALDYISEGISNKAGAFTTLLGFILTPINFNILGFTLADIGGIPLMIVIGLYIICYVGIGLFLFRALNPFGGL